MPEKHYIDSLFRERLLDAATPPPAHLWRQVQDGLRQKSRRRMIVLYRVAAVITAVFLSFGLGYYLSWQQVSEQQVSEQQVSEQQVSEQQGSEQQVSRSADQQVSEQQGSRSADQQGSEQQGSWAVADIGGNEKYSEAGEIVQETVGDEVTADPVIIPAGGNQNTPASAEKATLILPALPYAGTVPDPFPMDRPGEKESRKILMGGGYSPMISQTTGASYDATTPNTLAGALTMEQQEGEMMSYAAGLGIRLFINPKLSLQSGINYLQYRYETSDPALLADYVTDGSPDSYEANTAMGSVTIQSDHIPLKEEYTYFSTAYAITDYNLVQNAGYIEIPLVLKYQVLGHKISLNVSAGGAAGLLAHNAAYFAGEGGKTDAGKTEGLNTFIFSAIAGLGVDYPILPKLYLGIEPGVKYALRGLNENDGLSPLTFSFTAGLAYSIK